MKGLTKKEVLERQRKFGLNEIERKPLKTKIEIIKDILIDPIIIIMMVAFGLTILTNLESGHFSESFVILSLIVLNMAISFVQEVKTISKLKSLEALNEDTAIVIRDGIRIEIPAIMLVKDDIIELKLGTIARADIRVISAKDAMVDESFLTGESEAVQKHDGDIIYSNSPIINGMVLGRITATGMNTKIGKIVKQVTEVENVKSQLEIKILNITKTLMKLAFTMALIIFILSLLNGETLDTAFSFLISILIATVPEGLATVLTIVLTFMASKMARNKALVKKVNLLETLGEVSYVCSDKTGTITENKMRVTKKKYYLHEPEVTAIVKEIIDTDSPTTRAIHEYINTITTLASDLKYRVLDEIPFNSTKKYSLYLMESDEERIVIAIGAPDVLVDLEYLGKEYVDYATLGLRTIVVAGINVNKDTNIDVDVNTLELKPLCLFGIQDPPKESAIATIREFEGAGITPVMITGDGKITATSIAKQTGIIKNDHDLVLSHDELRELSDEALEEIILQVKVYARAKPEDKLRIVKALQAKGQITAMMGDGTNDSIALRQANVGIAMGVNGTDISKDAADLILLDDNYSTIDVAIQGGRLIFANLRKFVRQMLTSNTAHASTIMFALIYGLFTEGALLLPMTPILILWINIVSDAIPCLALGLDNEENDLMSTGPIASDANILTRSMIGEILLRGMTIGLLVLIGFLFIYEQTQSEELARTVGFMILSFGQLIHIFDARSHMTIYGRNPFANKWLLLTVLISIILNLVLVYTSINSMFGLVPLSASLLVSAIVFSSIPTLFYSLFKFIYLKMK